jgi:hypothetical protein
MKYAAVGGLVAFVGTLAGAWLGPIIAPMQPILDASGNTIPQCGMPVVAAMLIGGIVGSIVGGSIGAFVAYFLPDPKM